MTIEELCQRFNVSRRTIRYYVEEGVIPPPSPPRGRNAQYDIRHVEAIQAYRALKHTNVVLDDAIAFCKEEGITLQQFLQRRENTIRQFGIGIA